MKKLIAILMVAAMLLVVAGCGTDTPADTQGGSQSQEKSFTFTYKGTEITFKAPAEPIVAALGEPHKYSESASCAFEGLDKSYDYGSFYLETYPKGDEDFVYGWWFADDSVTTQEGIYIGATQAEVEKAYGTECYNGSNAFTVKKADGTLTVILEDGAVTSIQYAINVN